ncbi:MAG: AgmX/PglI C-terminal domain-containing protein [Myxococcales bacterium]|nr:MAG: AgmX/PglI C-terminal domain-containing protein [Myxococcales bacterium]
MKTQHQSLLLAFITLGLLACGSGKSAAAHSTPRAYEKPEARQNETERSDSQSHTQNTDDNNAYDSLSEALQANTPHIQNCYDQLLRNAPELEGRVVVQFRLLSSGYVDQAYILNNTTESPELADCIKHIIAKLQIKTPPASSVTLQLPFVFAPP